MCEVLTTAIVILASPVCYGQARVRGLAVRVFDGWWRCPASLVFGLEAAEQQHRAVMAALRSEVMGGSGEMKGLGLRDIDSS